MTTNNNIPSFPGFHAPISSTNGNMTDVYYRYLKRFNDVSLEGITVVGSVGLKVDGSPVGSGGTLTLTNTGVRSVQLNQPTAGIKISTNGVPETLDVNSTFSLSNDLLALENLNSVGYATRIDTDTWAQRSIIGTTSRIFISNGDGVFGNTSIDIDSGYIGQTSINTLGTITTGVWNGTTISLSNGGTGATTQPDAANAILPSQTGNNGKFLTTDGTNVSWSSSPVVVTSISGTPNQITASASTGAVTLSIPSTFIAPGTIESTGNLRADTTQTFIDQISSPALPSTGLSQLYSIPYTGSGISQLRVQNSVGDLAIGYELHTLVYNTTGSTISANQVVYVNGNHSHTPTIALAKADSLTTLPAIGITQYAIPNNSYGVIQSTGILDGVDTHLFTAGQPIYVSNTTAGAYTATAPTSSTSYIQFLGIIQFINPTQGSIQLSINTPLAVVRAISAGGTGQTTANAAFNALSPMTTLGDIIYEDSTPSGVRLAGNTTTTKKFLTQTGNGTISAAPGWNTISSTDIPSLGANPSVNIGLSAVNGSATTYLRSDGAPALSQSISPTWTGNHTFSPSSGNTVITSGLLGVGTSSPSQTLEVLGNISVRDNKTASVATNSRWFGGAYTGNQFTLAYMLGGLSSNQITFGGGTGGGEPATLMTFNIGAVGSTGAGTEVFRIASSAVTSQQSINGPSFIPTSSTVPTNGLYLPAANTIGFATNSSARASIDSTGNFITSKGNADQSYSLQTPATGFTITISNNVRHLILNPAAGLATGTVTMPSSPIDGQMVGISTSQTITTLTVSANTGQSLANAFSGTLTGGSVLNYIYNLSGTKWFRI